jgi:radical SAM protein with 4Fe4S-binding SPASM domain
MKEKKLFNRLFIEISNICNLHCSFCPEIHRKKQKMSLENFKHIIKECAPLTDQVFFHLMGEPLLHPDFPQMIQSCSEIDLPVQLTTNGTLIPKIDSRILMNPIIRQINFSLQSFKDQWSKADALKHLSLILAFTKDLHTQNPNTYINLRLWNIEDANLCINSEELSLIEEFYGVSINKKIEIGAIKSKKIWNRVYLHFDSRFEWPSFDLPHQGTRGTCHALKSQIGILTDGNVVPCCLDKDGHMILGNCLEQPLEEIIYSPRALAMKEGFSRHDLSEKLCQHCTYAKRFSKNSH